LPARAGACTGRTPDRHAVNPLLALRFSGRDLPHAKQMGALFFCMGAGGPEKYEGRDMRTVHAGMNISERELIVCVRRSHLVVAAVIIHSGTHARKRVRPG